MDLEKLALMECFETFDAVDTSPYAPNASPLTGCVRKISMQPAQLWLCCTCMNAVENDAVEAVSPQVRESPAVSGFVRYVEAVSAEPLEYWLRPNCEVDFPSTDGASFEHVAAVNANCTWPEPESDVASVTSFIHRISQKPDSFWVISANDKNVGLNSCGLPLCAAVSNDALTQLGSVYASNFWLPQSSSAVHLDQTEVVVNDDGTTVSFEFKSTISAGKDAADFSFNDYFALLTSKPADCWLWKPEIASI